MIVGRPMPGASVLTSTTGSGGIVSHSPWRHPDAAGRDDEPVDPSIDQQLQVERLALRIVGRIAQQDA